MAGDNVDLPEVELVTAEMLRQPIRIETRSKGQRGFLTLEGFMLHHAITGNAQPESAIALSDHERLMAAILLLNPNYPFMSSELQLGYDTDWPGFKPQKAYGFVDKLRGRTTDHFVKRGEGRGRWYSLLSRDDEPNPMLDIMEKRTKENAKKNGASSNVVRKHVDSIKDVKEFYSGRTPELFTTKKAKTASAVAVVTIGSTVVWKYITHRREQ